MTTLRRLIVAIPLLCLAFSGCGTGHHTAAAPPADTIVIRNFSFAPGTLSVAPGATITVHNEDGATHTVTATDKSFDTGDVPGGGTATFRAPTKPGHYAYICQIHQYMTGSLVVR